MSTTPARASTRHALDLIDVVAHAGPMTRTVGVREATADLSRLLEAVERGEDVVIERSGTPIARLVPVHPTGRRQAGTWRGRVVISDDFDDAAPHLTLAFEDGAESR